MLRFTRKQNSRRGPLCTPPGRETLRRAMSQEKVEIMSSNRRAFIDREFDATQIDHIGT